MNGVTRPKYPFKTSLGQHLRHAASYGHELSVELTGDQECRNLQLRESVPERWKVSGSQADQSIRQTPRIVPKSIVPQVSTGGAIETPLRGEKGPSFPPVHELFQG